MDKLEAMRVFCTVVEAGSFANAADKLAQSTSAVSRWVAQLESHLNVRLLNRTTRRISLTESGHAYYERCVQWLLELDALESSVSEQSQSAQGTLRITTSLGFGLSYLAPAIRACQAQFPQLQFHVSLSGHMVDLVEEGFDLALRIGSVGQQHVVAKAMGYTQLLYAASPRYLAKQPRLVHPSDLAQHNCLIYQHHLSHQKVWTFLDAQQQQYDMTVDGLIGSDNSSFLVELAAQDMGICCAPCFIITPYLNTGRLVRILPNYHTPVSTIYAVYPHRKHLSAKVRLFIGFFSQWLQSQQEITPYQTES
ncbi:LysR family transcriptional regulator [Agitococcus lubricus]|uniref:Transcriptional regulator /LysR family transcriptional regulator n=1 Tax=Agitococcus lubricus TaxID=1077255 RepID=A0A2T5J0G3_9GAMM|nr:LysR family transcriptional regulator [Agitococcus lubricus]PTQ89834.1 transcriptional regulator /LysR family transcriptional regulator [Agitococcus lubricus]